MEGTLLVGSITIPRPISEIDDVVFPIALLNYESGHFVIFVIKEIDALTSIP